MRKTKTSPVDKAIKTELPGGTAWNRLFGNGFCPDRIEPTTPRRPANALNVEIGTPLPRCRTLSPDGRGAAWLLSGGSELAYGVCCCRACPRMIGEKR